jgi:hypothetical protein
MRDEVIRMELKYCECCGGLLLRKAGSGASYCSGCAERMRELAPPRAKRRGRPPKALALPVPAPKATDPSISEPANEGLGLDLEAVAEVPRIPPQSIFWGLEAQPGGMA